MTNILTSVLSLMILAGIVPVKIKDAEVFVGERPGVASFSWKLESSQKAVSQKAYQITVLDADGKQVWESGKIKSADNLHVPYMGPALEEGAKYSWILDVWTGGGQPATTEGPSWFNGMSQENWKAAWIGLDGKGKEISDADSEHDLAARYLRKTFTVDKEVKSAVLYICGLGSSECYMNGKRISDDVFGPLPTFYDKSVMYLTYDVKDLVAKGENALGAIIGNGRYFGLRGKVYYGQEVTIFGYPCLLAELRIKYADGTQQTIVSDTSWSATDKGPITRNNEFDGEHYDASLELGNWTEASYKENDVWRKAEIMDAPKGRLYAQTSPSLRFQDAVVPIEVRKTADGRIILDMGQNMVGVLNVRLKGKKGSPISLRFSEILQNGDPDNLYVDNLRAAVVKDVYTPATDGSFQWEPKFVYHGFRFVEISGLDYVPEAKDFAGRVLYDKMRTTGHFECSNEILNAIHHNAYWGIRGNYRGMPTDCPQRDERMGWLGDRATGCYGESIIFDNETLYAKWMLDIEESMREDGCISVVSPRFWPVYSEDVTWPYAFITGTDMLYHRFGNRQVVIDRYPAICKWMDFIIKNKLKNGILEKADVYGDWCLPPESPELIHSGDPTRITDGRVLATSVFYDILRKMTELCAVAGHPEDASKYEDLAKKIKIAYNKKFFDEKNCWYSNNTVTANMLSLRFGLAPEGMEQKLMESIVSDITGRWNSHVSVGVLGVQHLMRGLTENGQVDLAYKIATCDTYPSLGYMYRHGATTIWELWNGDTANPWMNSGNHVMLLGDTVIWLYEYLAGIRNAEGSIGYEKIVLKPYIPKGLDWVKAAYNSPAGLIQSAWKIENGNFNWQVSIPAGTTAEVYLPDGTKKDIKSGAYEFNVTLEK